MKRTNKYL